MKIVREHLFESYDSFAELQKLSIEIYNYLMKMSDLPVDEVFRLDIMITKSNYTVLKSFIESGIGIIYHPEISETLGEYIDGKRYSKYFNTKEIDEVNIKCPFGLVAIYVPSDSYMWKTLKNVIIHELQHAYDDFISDGKFTSSKQAIGYFKDVNQKSKNKYFNTQHEINAFFTGAINRIDFFEGDKYIRPLSDVYSEFIDAVEFENLNDKNKKIIQRRLAQYWHKIKDDTEVSYKISTHSKHDIEAHHLIAEWLKTHNTYKFIINDDLSIDVNSNCTINLKDSENILPDFIQFNIINGFFNCSSNNMISLKGCPREVKGSFNCECNKLKSLEFGPSIVGKNFNCYNNKLKSLKGAPAIINGEFNCNFNDISTLDGAPNHIEGNMIIYKYQNPIMSELEEYQKNNVKGKIIFK